MIFEITFEEIERSSTLDYSDLGKWCFVLNGCVQGFCDSREEALGLYQTVKIEPRH